MKTVAILHFAAPPGIGGVESTIYHHALRLARSGYSVTVIAGEGQSFDDRIAVRIIPEISSRHPEILQITHELRQGEVSPAFIALRDRLTDSLRDALATADVCVVHNVLTLHKNLPLTAALFALNHDRLTPMIAWSHDFAWQDPLYAADLHDGYPWDLLRTAWPEVDYVAVSQSRRLDLAALLSVALEQIEVVHPGVDVAGLLKLEPETVHLIEKLDLLSADPLVLLPARLTRRKNIEFALEVMAALVRQSPRATLVVTGPPGPHNPTNAAYWQELQTLRTGLGIAERVHFLYECEDRGRRLQVTDAVMSDFYQLADVLLFPSHDEGFGIPILEAGLVRLPIFAADIPPVRESAAGFAHLFDLSASAESVARRIAAALEESDTHRLRRRVLESYTWTEIVERQVIPLIDRVAKHGPE